MGGDCFFPPTPSTEEESLLGQDIPQESINSSVFSGEDEDLSGKLENGSVINGETGLNLGEFPNLRASISEAAERRRVKVYAEVLRSYEELQSGIEKLEEAKSKILSYTPGSWAEKAMDLSECDVPDTTSLLLIGPKGSGKSSLVNKISRALEGGVFVPERAQVSFNSSSGDGTYFLHEYMIPRGSASLCLYDTRSLSGDPAENVKMLKCWMTKGVRHGELVKRKSDSVDLKARLKCKARRSSSSSQLRPVNFVIFVVNGLSVLESMEGVDKKKQYSQMIATNFNNPLLSFKDDKPVVVVTHGDLLSLSDRARVHVYLGELLGVPPTRQIFDIPEDDDSATTLAITDMLLYCVERADRNLPAKDLSVEKLSIVACFLFWLAVTVVLVFLSRGPHKLRPKPPTITPSTVVVDWHKIRHLWSD